MHSPTPIGSLLFHSTSTLWVAGLLLIGGLVGSAMLHHGLQEAEEAALDRYVKNLASSIEADMLGGLREQARAQRRMATRVALSGMENVVLWRANAELYLKDYPYYRLLAVLNPDFEIVWLENGENTGLNEGERYPLDDAQFEMVENPVDHHDMVVALPASPTGRHAAITFLTPIRESDDHLGYLAGALLVPESLEAMVPSAFRQEIILRISNRQETVYLHPPVESVDSIEWDASFVADLDGGGHGFVFEFALSDEIRSQLTSVLPLVVLVSGVLLSLLMAVVVLLGLNAIRQASGLARSNRQLENEVAEREQAEKELEFLVDHDILTGLANRTGSTRFIKRLIEEYRGHDGQLALMFLDLDQFKDINDSLGHQLGDRLLCEIPRRLSGVLRESDFMGRHGGDEFLVAVVRESREQVEQLARNILRVMDEGFAVDDHRLFISASIGIAYFPESGGNVSDLIQNADTALFKAKSAGRNQFAVFTREMFAQAQHRLNLSRDIRHAVDDGDFQLVYQPIVRTRDLSLAGVEVLLRWQHTKGYMVPPPEFIRVAEETGIIGRLGQYVLERSLQDLARWKQLTDSPPWLAVNVSGAQVHETGFAEQLSMLLHQYRIEPELLHLEITEEVLIENLMRNRQMLQKLDEIGMRIVVDDFGIGYSSLAYLKNFPISSVKIDRSFVRDLATDPEDQAITRTICSLAADLAMQTVAEGVENTRQLQLLRSYQCSFAQGFLFSRPVECGEMESIIRGNRPWSDDVEVLSGSE